MSKPLPLEWVDRLFGRFMALWGAHKVGAAFPPEVHAEVKNVWAEQLGRFSGDTIARALQDLVDSGSEWPPSLPAFVEMCRLAAVAREQHAEVPALPAPKVDRDAGVDALRKAADVAAGAVHRLPSRAWAHRLMARRDAGHPFSVTAVTMAEAALRAGGWQGEGDLADL